MHTGSNEPNKGRRPSRREFLAAATALAGAAAVLPRSVSFAAQPQPGARAKAPRPPKDGETIRLGVIGTGGMGTAHCGSILSLASQGKANVQIVALADVCDPRAEYAAGVCEKNQGLRPRTFRNHRDLLALDDVHAVVIASPEHWHARHAIDSILAGKDTYLEKPMTLRADEAFALRRTVEANPEIVFTVGTQMIMLPKYREAKRLVSEGALGTPLWSQTSYCRNTPDGEWNYYSIDPAWNPDTNIDWRAWCEPVGPIDWDPKIYARWRRYRAYSTGIVGDLLVHQVTPLLMALDSVGWPVRVTASGAHLIDKDMENHDQVNLTIQFESGHIMIVAGATNNEVGLETIIRGNRANMYLGGRHCVIRPERVYVDEVAQQTVECPDIGNDQDMLRLNFFDCIRSRAKPDSGIDLGCKVMVAVDLAARSMWTGRAWTFDPSTQSASPV